MRVILSLEAQDDITNILLYTLQTWGAEQQDAYAALLDRGLLFIMENPDIGRSRSELYPGCRSYRIREHIVYYAVQGEDINIARVLHGRIDTKRYFK
jgi:toxin ParE1/3/4